jgi:hypothetical protein
MDALVEGDRKWETVNEFFFSHSSVAWVLPEIVFQTFKLINQMEKQLELLNKFLSTENGETEQPILPEK